jgi:hypothetical protein
MGKKNPAHGHHGLGARGQGKLLYAHTQAAQAVRQTKTEAQGKVVHQAPEVRQSDGHWKR